MVTTLTGDRPFGEPKPKVKGWRREKKTALITKMNPAWVDFSKDWFDVEPADFKPATDRMPAQRQLQVLRLRRSRVAPSAPLRMTPSELVLNAVILKGSATE